MRRRRSNDELRGGVACAAHGVAAGFAELREPLVAPEDRQHARFLSMWLGYLLEHALRLENRWPRDHCTDGLEIEKLVWAPNGLVRFRGVLHFLSDSGAAWFRPQYVTGSVRLHEEPGRLASYFFHVRRSVDAHSLGRGRRSTNVRGGATPAWTRPEPERP